MRIRFALPLLALPALACWRPYSVQVETVSRSHDSVVVRSPVKAHLVSGHTVTFPQGVVLLRDTLRGQGTRYDLTLGNPVPASTLPLDSVVGMEAYRSKLQYDRMVLYSTLTTVGVIAASVAVYCIADPKCFGSCPTFYSDSGDGWALEAEGYSFSIAPIFEGRDVDRLRARPDRDGGVRLEVRNEAFETHFTNQLELLEVRHGAAELVLSDPANRPLAVAAAVAPSRAHDRGGRDVRRELSSADGEVYRTEPARLAHARPGDLNDWIELAVPRPPGDSAALVFRLRNSLLNTVLLYDVMLGDRGARSLDWMAEDLDRVGPAVELARWFSATMGLRISVGDGAHWREAGRVRDTGPVAWKDVAVVVPISEPDSLRVRLTFPADNWRIDRVAVAGSVRRPVVQRHELAAVLDAAERADTAVRASLRAADARYLETYPGQRFTAVFETGLAPDSARTFLLASQGYYTEWVRRGWMTAPRDTTRFTPGDGALFHAIARWRTAQDTLERQFLATRVPVR